MAQRPVIIAYTKGDLKGAEFEVESASVARKVHPDAKITRFGDTQEPFDEEARSTPARAEPAEGKDAK